MLLPISYTNGSDKLYPTQPSSLAGIAQNIGILSQNEGLNRGGGWSENHLFQI